MNDRTFYDEAFFAELDQPIPLRKQVVEWIDRYCATTGKSHSFAWRKAYLELEGATGFRVPEKKGLDAVEKAGLMPQLLEVVKKLSGDCGDHATEVNSAIPDYIPYESDRSRWKTNATKSCAHENPIPDFVPHVSDRERWKTNGTKACDHEWGVFSTVLEDVTLLVQCVECGAYGKVSDPSADEWQQAFHAPSNPYHWPHTERVELLPACLKEKLMKWTTHVSTFGRTYTSGDWRIRHSFADPGEESYYESYYDDHWIDAYGTLAEAKRGAKQFMKIEQEAGRDRLQTLAILNTLGER